MFKVIIVHLLSHSSSLQTEEVNLKIKIYCFFWIVEKVFSDVFRDIHWFQG